MADPNWFARLTSGYATWAPREIESTEATIDGTGELPPLALLGQASWGFTASADLTVLRLLAGSASWGFTATATLRVDAFVPPLPEDDPSTEAVPLPENIVPSSAEWRLMTDTMASVSPLTGKTQTINRGGERWSVTLIYRNLHGGAAAVLSAYLASLRGQYGRASLPDHAYVRRGALAVNLAVNGSSQTGTTLVCDGGTGSVTDAVRAGDMFTLDDRLYMIVEDADTNVSGNITLTISPPLSESPANDATVNLLTPTGRFMLADNAVSWAYAPGGFTSFNSVELIEDRR